MEISKERVKNPSEVDDAYMCPICIHLLWKPMECQNCQRLFCKQCIDKYLKEKPDICPLCNSYQEKKCSPVLYALLCKFKIECENKDNGCNEVLLYELLEKHHDEQCQYQMKICRGCQKNILKKDLDEHEQTCGEVQIECIRCKLVYKRKEKHEQLDCTMNLLDRSNKKIESLEKVVENLQLNVQKFETTTNLLDQSNKKIESLEKIVEKLQLNAQKFETTTNLLDQSNKKIESLEKIVEKLQLNAQKFETTTNLLDQSNKKIESLEKVVENLQLNAQKFVTNADLNMFTLRIVHEIPLGSLLLSWKIIYDFPYNHVTTVKELRALKPECGEQIIVGAIQGSSSTILKIAAMGPSDILLLNSPPNRPTKYGNVHWYLTPRYSFGFAPSTTTINCNAVDTGEKDNSENRLSWCLNGTHGGWRAGAATNLGLYDQWRKIIMTEKN